MVKDKFYAVKRGKVPGIYDSWEQCQLQTRGFPGCEFKSFSSRAEAEQYMGESLTKSHTLGVKKPNATMKHSPPSAAQATTNQRGTIFLDQPVVQALAPCSVVGDGFYQLEFDGASKGNPGKAGAGALLKNPDGSVECQLSEGLGVATNNIAEYRGLILGLRAAVYRGAKRILVRGDSKLVCEQIKGRWQVRNEGIRPLWEEAKYLQSKFSEFRIEHVDREFNPRADELANIGVSLPESVFESEIAKV